MLYKDIVRILNLYEEKDMTSAKILSKISCGMQKQILDLKHIKKKIVGKNIMIFGAGPSLIPDLEQLMKLKNFDLFIKICADGATKALIEQKIIPDFVVSDLDGDTGAIKKANEKETILLIHAHGNNIEAIKKYVPKFKNLILTTQTNLKLKNLHNFGGFTDGDRSVFFALKFKPKVVILVGMDFGNKIGEYSKKISGEKAKFKLKKLKIGKKLIEEKCSQVCIQAKNLKIYDFTKNGTLKIERISFGEIEKSRYR
ncbi:MAG: DUF115 domain-containing protein [Candidatus Altarchaeum sp.]|nr:DUF115 domain-containing protein [Candidatus Altarchaeum sp.]